MRCVNCDSINYDGARFCVRCGAALAAPAQQAPATAAQPAPAAFSNAAPTYAAPPPYADATTYAAPPPYANATAYANPGVAQPIYGYPPAPQVVNNITVAASAPAPAPPFVVVQQNASGPSLIVRVLWFLFIGLWLGAICTVLAWLLNVTIIGLPLGLYIINRLPQIMTLKPVASHLQVTMQNGVAVVSQVRAPQRPFLVRALYFLLVGWWASGLWLLVAWLLVGATLGLGLPLAFWMFDRVPLVTTLGR